MDLTLQASSPSLSDEEVHDLTQQLAQTVSLLVPGLASQIAAAHIKLWKVD